MLNIVIEGPDKTGKDLIKQYVDIISNGKFVVSTRSPISTIIYNRKYNRKYNEQNYYKLLRKDTLYVFIDCDYDDRWIRCKLCNHESADWEDDFRFIKQYAVLCARKYNTIQFNSSIKTPYTIAKEIIKYANKI